MATSLAGTQRIVAAENLPTSTNSVILNSVQTREDGVVQAESDTEDEMMQSIPPYVTDPVVLYKRRYFMLAMFAALGFLQCSVWNTWGPITSSVKIAYPSFTDSNIATLAFWGPVTCLSGTIICTFIIQRKGLRIAVVISTLLMAVGTTLRCFSDDPVYFTLAAHIGAVLNGFAGVVVGVAPGLLSMLWFPMSFRTTATGIGCTFNQLGNAGGFFLGPYMVRAPLETIEFHERAVNVTNLIIGNLLETTQSHQLLRESIPYTDSKDLVELWTNFLHNTFVVAVPERVQSTEKLSGGVSFYQPFIEMRLSEKAKLIYKFIVQHNISIAELVRYEEDKLSNQSHLLSGDRFSPYPSNIKTYIFDGFDFIGIERHSEVTPQVQALLQHELRNYMYIVAGLCIGLFVVVLAFFEDQPPSPPIAMLQQPRPQLRNPRAVLIASVSSIPIHSLRRSARIHSPRQLSWAVSERASVRIQELIGIPDSVLVDERAADARLTSASLAPTVGNGRQYRTLGEMLRLAMLTLRSPSFLMLLLAYSLTLGINVSWSSVLEINLRPLGVTEDVASWIGVFITFGGVIWAIAAARLSDMIFGHLKLIIILHVLVATLFFLWLVLICNGCLPNSKWQIITSASLAGSLNYAVSPLFFELAMELGHPTPEDVLGSIISLSWNIASICFFFIIQMREEGTSVIWMNYVLVAQGVIVIIILLFVREEYKRSGPLKFDEICNTLREQKEHVEVRDDNFDAYNVSDDSDAGECRRELRRGRNTARACVQFHDVTERICQSRVLSRNDAMLSSQSQDAVVTIADDIRLLEDSSSDPEIDDAREHL